jgi:hypothetical protein
LEKYEGKLWHSIAQLRVYGHAVDLDHPDQSMIEQRNKVMGEAWQLIAVFLS